MTLDTKRDHRIQIVQAAGAATTLAAFALVFALAKAHVNIMGWYANWLIPCGAMVVGALAASGYAIAAWITGFKMTSRMMWSVVAQLTVSYFIAQYETYHLQFAPYSDIGFVEWFDLSTRAFSFSSKNGQPGDPLGLVGYLFRVLEIVGFIAGGVIVPLALYGNPYCEPCRAYKRASTVAVIPGGLPGAEMTDGPYADPAQESVLAIYRAAHAGDREAVRRLVAERGPLSRKGATRKLQSFTEIALTRCPRCAQGDLTASISEQQGSNNWHVTQLGGVALPSETVRAVFD
jgi:hypothetical protein